MSARRFPSSVFARGIEPDVRFTLANERTFLAWIRTALAFIAAGVALELLGLDLHAGLRLAASLIMIIAGTATPVVAWFGWARSERALRESRPLPSSVMGIVLGLTVCVTGSLVVLAIVLR